MFCVSKQVFSLAQPEVDNIIHTGNAKLMLVQQLQMPHAQMQVLRHFADAPRKLRRVGDLPPQHQQFMVVGGGGVMQHIIAQLQK